MTDRPNTESEIEEREQYLSTDAEHEALGALESTAYFLERARDNPDWWKWAMLSLHNAVQGFMVLALSGSTNWGTLRDEDIAKKVQAQQTFYRATEAGDSIAADAANEIMLWSPSRLASFLTLYARIKSNDWRMHKYTSSKSFVPREFDDRCMESLNTVRNDFAHFVPMRRHYLLSRFPAMTETGLFVIEFLVKKSRNIHWFDEQDEERFERAFEHTKQALLTIQTQYDGLARPPWPYCGSSADDADGARQ